MLKNLLILIIFLIGLAGVSLTSYGAWLIAKPAGYITAGAWCLLFSLMYSKAMADPQPLPPQPEGDN
jgi:hypothetical protein